MAESKDVVQYDKAELRRVTSAFKAMDDEAVAEAKASSSALADYLKSKILEAAYATSNIGDDRIAEGSWSTCHWHCSGLCGRHRDETSGRASRCDRRVGAKSQIALRLFGHQSPYGGEFVLGSGPYATNHRSQ